VSKIQKPFCFTSGNSHIMNSSKEGIEKEISKHKALKLLDENGANVCNVVNISVVDWNGIEICCISVRPSDSVHTGMLQLQEQLRVPPVLQRLVCNKCKLEGSELWSVYEGYQTVQLAILKEVSSVDQ